MTVLLVIAGTVLVCLLAALAWWAIGGEEITAPPIPMEPTTEPIPPERASEAE